MHHEELLTISQVATLLNTSRWTVWRYVKDGKLAAAQLNGPNSVHVITRAELDRYLAASTAETAEPAA